MSPRWNGPGGDHPPYPCTVLLAAWAAWAVLIAAMICAVTGGAS